MSVEFFLSAKENRHLKVTQRNTSYTSSAIALPSATGGDLAKGLRAVAARAGQARPAGREGRGAAPAPPCRERGGERRDEAAGRAPAGPHGRPSRPPPRAAPRPGSGYPRRPVRGGGRREGQGGAGPRLCVTHPARAPASSILCSERQAGTASGHFFFTRAPSPLPHGGPGRGRRAPPPARCHASRCDSPAATARQRGGDRALPALRRHGHTAPRTPARGLGGR